MIIASLRGKMDENQRQVGFSGHFEPSDVGVAPGSQTPVTGSFFVMLYILSVRRQRLV
jgi:hypothetical protein